MNTLPTYNEQFNKITEAYIKGELKPMDNEFCFCGTLSDNDICWRHECMRSHNPYTVDELLRMEAALFIGIGKVLKIKLSRYWSELDYAAKVEQAYPDEKVEDAIFSGMVAALEVLKQIHIERGETIDAPPVFIQRPIIEPCK